MRIQYGILWTWQELINVSCHFALPEGPKDPANIFGLDIKRTSGLEGHEILEVGTEVMATGTLKASEPLTLCGLLKEMRLYAMTSQGLFQQAGSWKAF